MDQKSKEKIYTALSMAMAIEFIFSPMLKVQSKSSENPKGK